MGKTMAGGQQQARESKQILADALLELLEHASFRQISVTQLFPFV